MHNDLQDNSDRTPKRGVSDEAAERPAAPVYRLPYVDPTVRRVICPLTNDRHSREDETAWYDRARYISDHADAEPKHG